MSPEDIFASLNNEWLAMCKIYREHPSAETGYAMNIIGRMMTKAKSTDGQECLIISGSSGSIRRSICEEIMKAVPIELKEANNYVAKLHRHHGPVYRDKYRVAAYNEGHICGVVQCARPVSRMLDDGKTIEVVRLCTDGTPNACSFLYQKAVRIAKELGYYKIITYILENESGNSLKASGWKFEGMTDGGSWDRPSRKRTDKAPTCKKQRWSRIL